MRTLLALALLAACSSSPHPTAAAQEPKAAEPAHAYTAFSVKVSGVGRPVLFIPGLASSGAVWDGTIAHLGGHVEAHVLTLAGFAGQPPIDPPFLQTVHDQLVAYIRDRHLDHPIIVGHSLGGVMSLWLAETDPDIGGIIDVDGLPFIAGMQDATVTAEQAAAQGNAMRQQFLAMSKDAFTAQVQTFVAGMVTNPEAAKAVGAMGAASDQATVATAFAELFGKDLRPELATIHVPVTIIAASEQGSVPRDALEAGWHRQVDSIPHVNLQFVDKARHFVMLDQPDAFYALIDQALAH